MKGAMLEKGAAPGIVWNFFNSEKLMRESEGLDTLLEGEKGWLDTSLELYSGDSTVR